MAWWGWVIGGAILLGAELAGVDAQFYLVFVGSAAILTGLLAAVAPLPAWAPWAIFAALAIVSMVAFRSHVYRWVRGSAAPVKTGPGNDVLTLPVALGPGECCRVEHGGTSWNVQNDSDAPIAQGARARIERVHGLTLIVRPHS